MDPKYQLPTRKHLSTKLIEGKYRKIHENIAKKVEQVSSITLTTDLWSNRQMKSYIGITGHFILDWKINSIMVACHRFSGRHSACNIYDKFQEIIASFEINNKISTIITDNAYNMVNAFSLPGFDTLQQESDQSDSEDDIENYGDPNFELEDDALALLPPVRNSCFAHTLQLVVKDGLNKADIFSKVSTIISHVRKSTVATDVLIGENRLQSSVPTRWNSQLIMIKSILKVDQDKLNALDTAKLAAYERNTLRDFVEILSPFEEATDIAQIENKVSSSLVIPCIRGTRGQLSTLRMKYSNALVKELAESVERRLTIYESEDAYTTASVLDPRFKLKWCKDGNERDNHKSELLSKMYKIENKKSNRPVVVECESKQPKSKRTKLFSFMDSDEEDTENIYTDESELREYLLKPTIPGNSNPLAFWKDHADTYPKLAVLAMKHLAVPASSAPVERLFSIARKVFRPDRCNLSDKTFETLMFLRSNMD